MPQLRQAHLVQKGVEKIIIIPRNSEQVRKKRTIDKSPLDVVELRYHIKGVIVCQDHIRI